MNKKVFIQSVITFLLVVLAVVVVAEQRKAMIEYKGFKDGQYYRIKNLTNYVLICEIEKSVVRLNAKRVTVWIKLGRQRPKWHCE